MNKLWIILILFLAYATFPFNGIAQEKIQMTLEKSGVYTVPCEVNGLRMRLIFDTGAKDVQISSVEALFMLRNGYIDEDDFVGTGMYSTADGTISEHAIVNIKTIKIGNKVLTDVNACISSNIDAPMLLGQSALSKLGAYSIDGSTLILSGIPDNTIYDLKGNPVSAYYTGKGTCRYKDNGVYTGDFVNGKMDGRGTIDFGKDGKFEGTFKNGNATYGTHTFNESERYIGQYKNGNWNGRGSYYFSDGRKYEGDFIDGVSDGKGTFIWPNGDKYVGEFKNDVFWGKGTMNYADGCKYIGDFINNKKEGEGTMTFPDGTKYVGHFKNDNFHGYGTYYWEDGAKYEGYWSDGKQNGTGTMSESDGEITNGIWKNGELHGNGVTTFSNGDKYEGTLGDIITEGTYTWKNGNKYIGQFEDGVASGYGIKYYNNGDRYEGYWKGWQHHGQGTMFYADGKVVEGEWYYGLCKDCRTNKVQQSNQNYSVENITTNTKVENRRWLYETMKKENYDVPSFEEFCYDIEDADVRDWYYNEATSLGYNLGSKEEFEHAMASSPKPTRDATFGNKDNEDYYLAQTKTEINLRSGPGTNYKILDKIPQGGFVVLTSGDSHQAFRKVIFIDKNIIGYVSRDYLTNFKKIEVDERGNLQVEGRNNKQNADVKIKNNTNKNITIVIGSQVYIFSPYETRTLNDLTPKRYKIMASAPGVIPYVGFDTVQGGYEYSWTFYIRTGRQ